MGEVGRCSSISLQQTEERLGLPSRLNVASLDCVGGKGQLAASRKCGPGVPPSHADAGIGFSAGCQPGVWRVAFFQVQAVLLVDIGPVSKLITQVFPSASSPRSKRTATGRRTMPASSALQEGPGKGHCRVVALRPPDAILGAGQIRRPPGNLLQPEITQLLQRIGTAVRAPPCSAVRQIPLTLTRPPSGYSPLA